MQSPEQVSDFDADAWFVRNRRPMSGQPPVTRARGPRGRDPRARGPRLNIELREFFSWNFCMVAIIRFMNRAQFKSMPGLYRKPQSKIRPGSAGKKLAKFHFHHYFEYPST